MKFDEKYFKKFNFKKNDIAKYLRSAHKDLDIAKQSDIPDVIFQFSYNAFVKLGISLIAGYGRKVSSRAGHHIKIIEMMAEILGDDDIAAYGNSMRKIRNTELYDGGSALISQKQAAAYLAFVEKTFKKSDVFFKKILGTLF